VEAEIKVEMANFLLTEHKGFLLVNYYQKTRKIHRVHEG
jgi:hypothetical protein